MAVVIDPEDREAFMKYAREENLEATEVAVVTEEPRLVMSWRGKESSIFPVHSWIPTARIRKMMCMWKFRRRQIRY